MTDICEDVRLVVADQKDTDPGFSRLDVSWDNEDGNRVQLSTDEDDIFNVVDVTCPLSFATHMDNWRPHIGAMFRQESDFETFMKLPLSNTQKHEILSKLGNPRKSVKRPKAQDAR